MIVSADVEVGRRVDLAIRFRRVREETRRGWRMCRSLHSLLLVLR